MNLAIGQGFLRGVVVALGCWMVVARAADDLGGPRDTLVYKDGDRVNGKWVETTGGIIVFRSDRFGEVRVPAGDAVVIKGEGAADHAAAAKPAAAVAKPAAVVATPVPPPKPVAAGTPAKRTAMEREAERVTLWDRFSPAVLTARVRNYFGPWHGRMAFSTEVVQDTVDRNNLALEGNLKRKWKSDEVQVTARYDFSETNRFATTDLIKGSGLWRHDFTQNRFVQYRPSVELNRASVRLGVPNDYVLLQQEIGTGLSLVTTPSRKLRMGISENMFDIWNTKPTPDHASHIRASIFEEGELALPWRINLLQRGVWYPIREQKDGWENRFELNKKLTETLSAAVLHEIRRNNPDGSSPDYTRLRLLFGFDF